MKFYSGFSLKNEEYFFKEFMNESEYTISGFSYGAIKAFEEVKKELENGRRVDTLQLFSPAFFQSKSEKFKRLQTLSYGKNKDLYIKMFLKSCFSPHELKKVEQVATSLEELNELLEYTWSPSDLLLLQNKGVKIEVYLGSEDAVVDAPKAKEFFVLYSTVTYIKNANHFLQLD